MRKCLRPSKILEFIKLKYTTLYYKKNLLVIKNFSENLGKDKIGGGTNNKNNKSNSSFKNSKNFITNSSTELIEENLKKSICKKSSNKNNYKNNIQHPNLPHEEEKSIDNYTFQDFLKIFQRAVPFSYDKVTIIHPDQNLSCFIKYSDILNKPKATSLSKQFIEDIIAYLNSGNDEILEKAIYEENFINKLKLRLEKILNFNKSSESFIKYKIHFKPTEEKSFNRFKSVASEIKKTPLFIPKKLRFNINLYNIKNYVCLGVEPDRKMIKNTKFLSHYQNMCMENPLNKNNENESIKTDVLTYRETSKIMLGEYESIPLCLLSQFEFSFLPSDEGDKIVIVLELFDELNGNNKKFELSLNSVDFLVESEIFRMKYGDIIKLEKENDSRQKEVGNILDLNDITQNDSDGNDSPKKNSQNKEIFEEPIDKVNMDMNTDILNLWKFLTRENIGLSNSKFKIIDVNNFMEGNKLI